MLGFTLWARSFDIATLGLSFLLSGILYQRLSEPEQKKWLFLGGVLLALIVSGLYYAAELFFFPHSAHAPHSFDAAYFGGSMWVLGGLFMAAWSSDRQKAGLLEVR